MTTVAREYIVRAMVDRSREREHSLAADVTRMIAALTTLLGDRSAGPAVWPTVSEPTAGDRSEARRLLAAIGLDFAPRKKAQPAAHSAPCVYAPLRELATRFSLSAAERDTVLLALMVELDQRFCRLMTLLNDHAARNRPTLGLAAAVAAVSTGERVAPIALLEGPLVRDGLVVLGDDGPLPDLDVRLPRDVVARLLLGRDSALDQPTVDVRAPRDNSIVVDDHTRARLDRWRATSRNLPLIIVGARGVGRRTVAHAIALPDRKLAVVGVDRQTPLERFAEARREAKWHDAALAVHVEQPLDRTGWRNLWRCLDGIEPLVLALTRDSLAAALADAPRPPFVVELAEPGPGLRERLWRALLPPDHALDDGELGELARRFRFTPARIAVAVRHASTEQALAGGGSLSMEGLALAARASAEVGIGSLARKLPLPYSRSDLVVSAKLATELDLAITWLRERRRILDEWRLGSRVALGHGFIGLFAGPPGTGKTMAAQVIARELDLDLYLVDLSCVVSKYIGETEKNLARVFDEARAAGAGLLFDEADALFGKRSEARDAHDRYANIEIGYLLQKIEEFDGFAVLTTNRLRDIDEAFVRRFHSVLDFQLPSPAERARIWQGMLPDALPREPLDFAQLAQFQLTGGEIRNVVVAASTLAAGEKIRLSMRHLDFALRREYAKNGRVIDERLFGPKTSH